MDIVLRGRSVYLDIFESPKKEDIKIAEKALKMVNIFHLKEKSYNKISGGEQQLVLIARVLTQDPKLIIIDEPTSSLDFENQIKILKIIDKLAQKGISVIMTSHFPDHVFITGNRVAILKNRKLSSIGSP